MRISINMPFIQISFGTGTFSNQYSGWVIEYHLLGLFAFSCCVIHTETVVVCLYISYLMIYTNLAPCISTTKRIRVMRPMLFCSYCTAHIGRLVRLHRLVRRRRTIQVPFDWAAEDVACALDHYQNVFHVWGQRHMEIQKRYAKVFVWCWSWWNFSGTWSIRRPSTRLQS